jgi:hypothetical protein
MLTLRKFCLSAPPLSAGLVLLAAVTSLVWNSGLAAANPDRGWHTGTAFIAGFPMQTRQVLYYGVPETDDIVIAFACGSDNKTLAVRSFVGTRGTSANRPARITLKAGRRQAFFEGVGISNEESGTIDISASEPMGPALYKLRALINGRPPASRLTIATPGVMAEVSLHAASTVYQLFEQRCLSNSMSKSP